MCCSQVAKEFTRTHILPCTSSTGKTIQSLRMPPLMHITSFVSTASTTSDTLRFSRLLTPSPQCAEPIEARCMAMVGKDEEMMPDGWIEARTKQSSSQDGGADQMMS